MPDFTDLNSGNNHKYGGNRGFLYFAGCRFWTASLLPALAGTFLPFWLRPPHFSFRWAGAIELLLAAVLLHSGFSFLLARIEGHATATWPGSRLLRHAGASLALACLLGLHLNSRLTLHPGVSQGIFILYGISAICAGVLYVAPPFRFYRRAGGEIVIAEGLGMIPVLGAYLVQVGDITRRVYLASLPLVAVTGLWVWMDELASRMDDEEAGRRTLVMEFGPSFSGRFGVFALVLLFAAALSFAVASSSLPQVALIALLPAGAGWRIAAVSWKEHLNLKRMSAMRALAFRLHLAAGVIIAASPLLPRLMPRI